MPQPDIHRYLRHGLLPQLHLFEASARLGSFTRAAHELHMAQPTASVQMKKLSETVGVPLFEQVGKRLVLTDAGRELYESCQQVFQAFTRFESALATMRGLESGRLRLAVSTTAMCFAPRLLGAFVARYAGIGTSTSAHNRATLVERLGRNEDDLYLFADAPDMEGVVTQELLANPLVVLARDDHPLARERTIPLERLAREPMLMREEGSGARRMAMRLFRARGLTPTIRMELGSNEAIKEAILAGVGVAIMSRYTLGLDPESPRYRCLDVAGFPLENHWYLVYPQARNLTPAARAFLDFARLETRALMQLPVRR